MMRYLFTIILISLVSLSCSQSISSRSSYTTKSKKAIAMFKEGDNYRVRRQYSQAIDLFTKAVDKDDEFAEAWFMLGMTFKMTFQLEESIKCFEKAMALFPSGTAPKELYFEVGQVYMHLGNYVETLKTMGEYINRGGLSTKNGVWANKAILDSEYALKNINNSSTIEPRPLPSNINTFNMQYFPVLTVDQKVLIYTKRGPSDDEDMVVSFKNAEGKWGDPTSISNAINSRWNEGTCAISADASTLIFTTCQGRDSFGSCDLYITRRVGSDWSMPENMGGRVNSRFWDSQPALSSDGRTLYFVSSRDGGIGGKDIWITYLQEDNSWSEPVNAGKKINTPFDEVSPFLHANNTTLYFASNGLPGFGGFDIYYTELRENWKLAKNLGYPVNTSKDQVSLFITADGKKALYSDESIGGMGMNSKLFEFDIPEELQVEYVSNYISGRVLDDETKEPVQASVELFNLTTNNPVNLMKSDPSTGNYLMVLPEGASYALYVDGEGYLFESQSFDYMELDNPEPINRDFYLKKAKSGSSVVLNNLFFDLNKYELRSESLTELDKVVEFLESNPNLQVEITGHTDNSGTKRINDELSSNRAKAVYLYIIEKGIRDTRVNYRGLGDTQPMVPNDSGSNRALNRRIEMTIK